MAPPAMTEKTVQQPAMEEPVAESLPEPQQTSGRTTVPEKLVKGRAEPSTSAPSTNPAEGNTSAPRVSDQIEEQRPEVAQSTFADATAHGKAIVIAETANSRPAPLPEEEAEEDEVEEVLGCP